MSQIMDVSKILYGRSAVNIFRNFSFFVFQFTKLVLQEPHVGPYKFQKKSFLGRKWLHGTKCMIEVEVSYIDG
jgi:hypothetical protein